MSLPEEYGGFRLICKQDLPEHGATGYLYEHNVFKTQFLYLHCPEDKCNTFTVTFKTPALDSKGRSHMLEHLCLDGTEKYPVRNLFFELRNRSYSNYMNGWTSTEWTSYPFSSTNEIDFLNVLDVYLDCAFHPNLNELEFMSECYRLEFEDNDQSKPLKHSGVVYNEMCGAYAEAIRMDSQLLVENLFPESSTRFSSGGIPEEIAKSSIGDIKNHHARFYHPSNAFFYQCGSFDIRKTIDKINSSIGQIPILQDPIDFSSIKQEKWNEPRIANVNGPMDTMIKEAEKQFRSNIVWYTNEITDMDTIDDLEILQQLLSAGQDSPLYIALVSSGLAPEMSCVFQDQQYNNYFKIGVRNTTEENANKLYDTVMETLNNIAQNGFDQERVQSIINTIELENRTKDSQIGLKLFMMSATYWIHGGNPLECLQVNKSFERVQNNLKQNPNYYVDILKKYLLQGKHRLVLNIIPIQDYNESKNQKITKELEDIKNKMTQEEKDEIIKNSKALEEYINQPKPLDLLPRFEKKFIDEKYDYVPIENVAENIYFVQQPLNGITYLRINIKVKFDHPLLQYMPILSGNIDCLGAGDMDDEQLAQRLRFYCSALYSGASVKEDYETNEPYVRVFLSLHFLDRNFSKAIELLDTIISQPHLDNHVVLERLLKRHLIYSQRGLSRSAGSTICTHLGSKFSDFAALNDEFSGIGHLKFISDIVKNNKYQEVCGKLKTAYDEILMKGQFQVLMHASSKNNEHISLIDGLIKKFNAHSKAEKSLIRRTDKRQNIGNTYFKSNTNTNFTGCVLPTYKYTDIRSVDVQMAGEYLENQVYPEEIRVKHGAYGAFASPSTRTFKMYTYRDQKAIECLAAFKSTMEELCNGTNITDPKVDDVIVSHFASVDSPDELHNKGLDAYDGKSFELMQSRRSAFLHMTKEKIIEAAKGIRDTAWISGIFSSPTITPPPEGFEIMDLTE